MSVALVHKLLEKVGAPGRIIVKLTTVDCDPSPIEFIALAEKLYNVPIDKPDAVNDVVAVVPPGALALPLT